MKILGVPNYLRGSKFGISLSTLHMGLNTVPCCRAACDINLIHNRSLQYVV